MIWAESLFEVVVMLSDQQLVTGIAVLSSAIYLRNRGSIAVYHYTIATDLAWFSSNTHLLSLLALRGHLSEERRRAAHTPSLNRSFHRRIMRTFPAAWRATFMIIMVILLIYANTFTGYAEWYDQFGCPAKCLPVYPLGGTPLRWLIVNLALIFWAYSASLIGLFGASRNQWLHLRGRIVDNDREIKTALSQRPVMLAAYVVFSFACFAIWLFLGSEIFEVLFQVVWFVLGIIWLLQSRRSGQLLMDCEERKAENKLGFGQLVPILLLALPVMAFFEALYSRFLYNYA